MKFMKKLVFPVLVCVAIFSACKKDDDPVTTMYSKTGIIVNTSKEVPAVTTSNATGTMDVSYDKTTRLLTYKVSWNALSDSITGSHIHGTASTVTNANVVVPFTVANKGALTGNYAGTFTVDGIAIKEDSLLLGKYYLNIHTKKNPGGEIRGQIEF
ncbi:MAG: CHRD domain-containing protein [Chitinophagaceae bacterium]